MLAYIPNKHTNMSIHICVLLIKVSVLAGLGHCVFAHCESQCRCVCCEAGGRFVGCLRLQL